MTARQEAIEKAAEMLGRQIMLTSKDAPYITDTRQARKALRQLLRALELPRAADALEANARDLADALEEARIFRSDYDVLAKNLAEAMAALREKEERVKALEDRYEDWKPVSEPPHQIQIERGEVLNFYRDDEDGTYWNGTWSNRRDADLWCRVVTAPLNARARSLSSGQPASREQRGNEAALVSGSREDQS